MAQQPNKINGKSVFIFLYGNPLGAYGLEAGFSVTLGSKDRGIVSTESAIRSMVEYNQLGHYIRDISPLSVGGIEVRTANIDLHANPDNSILIIILDSNSGSIAQVENVKGKYPNARFVLLDRRREGDKSPQLLSYFHAMQYPVIEMAPRTVEGCANLQAALNIILAREGGDKNLRWAGGVPNNGYLSQAGVLLHPGFERGGM